MKEFKEINIRNFNDNIFELFDKKWTLITAGTTGSYNMMTASWGTLGTLWNKPIAICFIRPHRHTHGFAISASHFTLSFFDEKDRSILDFCGTKSGRDCDKAAETGLIPFETRFGNISYEQARFYFECKKLYYDNFKSGNFIYEELISKNYPRRDFHTFFIGEIEGCYYRHSGE